MHEMPGTRRIEPRKRAASYEVSQNDDAETVQDKTEFNSFSEVNRYIGEGTNKGRNFAVPKPPKRGEMMHCQQCGKPMPPAGFSENPFTRKREFKWQLHAACMEELENLADRRTPGLLAERNRKY